MLRSPLDPVTQPSSAFSPQKKASNSLSLVCHTPMTYQISIPKLSYQPAKPWFPWALRTHCQPSEPLLPLSWTCCYIWNWQPPPWNSCRSFQSHQNLPFFLLFLFFHKGSSPLAYANTNPGSKMFTRDQHLWGVGGAEKVNFDAGTMPQETPVSMGGGVLSIRVSHIKEKWTGFHSHVAQSQNAVSLARTWAQASHFLQ